MHIKNGNVLNTQRNTSPNSYYNYKNILIGIVSENSGQKSTIVDLHEMETRFFLPQLDEDFSHQFLLLECTLKHGSLEPLKDYSRW